MSESNTVHQAWSAVMGEATALGKNQRTDSGQRFNFRGIDDVMNLVGPILRTHGKNRQQRNEEKAETRRHGIKKRLCRTEKGNSRARPAV